MKESTRERIERLKNIAAQQLKQEVAEIRGQGESHAEAEAEARAEFEAKVRAELRQILDEEYPAEGKPAEAKPAQPPVPKLPQGMRVITREDQQPNLLKPAKHQPIPGFTRLDVGGNDA